MVKQLEEALRIIQRKEVQERTTLSKSALYLKIKEGSFPRPVKLSKRRVGWISEEIAEWLTQQIEQSRKGV